MMLILCKVEGEVPLSPKFHVADVDTADDADADADNADADADADAEQQVARSLAESGYPLAAYLPHLSPHHFLPKVRMQKSA